MIFFTDSDDILLDVKARSSDVKSALDMHALSSLSLSGREGPCSSKDILSIDFSMAFNNAFLVFEFVIELNCLRVNTG